MDFFNNTIVDLFSDLHRINPASLTNEEKELLTKAFKDVEEINEILWKLIKKAPAE